MSRTIQFVETDPEPGSNYTPAYRQFFARLRRARIDKGLSLFEVAELVGLHLTLAYEFENLIAPLPFEWLEVWCKVVGVPFADYLVVYWASEEAYFEAQERESEADALSSTEAELKAGEAESEATEAPANPCVNDGFGIWASLRAALARVASFLRALFPTP